MDDSVSPEQAREQVGPGWHGLLSALYANKPVEVVVVQVKEKFGGLRFYWDAPVMAGDALLDFSYLVQSAERISFFICEACGAAGSNANRDKSKNWIKTVCKEHAGW